jgi:hypothetical protein
MAWVTEDRSEFTDITGLDWKVDIELDAYAGDLVTMQAETWEPLKIEWLTASDDLISSPIKGSMATMIVRSETNFQHIGLYSVENFKRRVKIYHGSTLYQMGYIGTDYSEPYDTPPYNVNIIEYDGLGLLKFIPFKDGSGDAYSGRYYISYIVLEILGKIGHTEFKEYCNIYETNISNGVGDSLFDQIKINCDVFKDMDCYTVLFEILKTFNAIIRQESGVFHVFRPFELWAATVYGRHFTGTMTKTSITLTPEQLISRSTGSTNIADVNGGILRMMTPYNDVVANQDFGNKQSWIQNWDFQPDTFDWIYGNFENWTQTGGFNKFPLSTFSQTPTESTGIYFMGTGTEPTTANYISQQFGASAIISATDVLSLSFEYAIYNETGGVTNVDIWIQIKDVAGTRWLDIKDIDELQWQNSLNYVNWTESSVPKTTIEWKSFNRYVVGIPAAGPYEIRLYTTKASTYLLLKDIRLVVTSDEVTLVKKRHKFYWSNPVVALLNLFEYTVRNVTKTLYEDVSKIEEIEEVVSDSYTATNNLNAPNVEVNYILGDVLNSVVGMENIAEQFKGALTYSDTDTLAEAAANFDTDHSADYSGGGVTVTHSGNDIIFTSVTPGIGFTGSTTITNTSGDLSGTVVNTQANVTAVARIDRIVFTGSGDGSITCDGTTRVMIWDTDIDTTIDLFISSHGATYLAGGVVLNRPATGVLTFTAQVPGVNFTGTTSYTGDMTATVYNNYVANRTAVAQVDTITLTGTEGMVGTADILCDGVTEEVDVAETFGLTSIWNTRGGSENTYLKKLMADEIKTQFSRAKQMIQIDLMEYGATPAFSLIKNIQDPLNKDGSNNRVFVVNRAALNVRDRTWTADIVEVIVST